MDTINTIALQLYAAASSKLDELKENEGQTGIEWVTIAAAFLVLVFAAFRFLGGSLGDAVDSLVDKVFGPLL